MEDFGTMKAKVKYGKVREMVDTTTGEVVNAQQVFTEVSDADFLKVWLMPYLFDKTGLTNKKMSFLFWMIDEINRPGVYNNCTLKMTQAEAAAAYRVKTHKAISIITVKEAFSILQDGDFPVLVRIKNGEYMLNPALFYKGQNATRADMLITFQKRAAEISQKKAKN